MMPLHDLLSHFAVALGIGLLIGLERGWKARKDRPGSRTAGFRTFAITGLLGGTVGAIAQALGGGASVNGGIVLGLGFAAYAAVITVFCLEENRAEKNFSATTAVVTVSMARLAPQPLSLQSASLAILAAVLSNTLSKVIIGAIIGRGRFALEIVTMSVASLIAAGLALALAFALFPG